MSCVFPIWKSGFPVLRPPAATHTLIAAGDCWRPRRRETKGEPISREWHTTEPQRFRPRRDRALAGSPRGPCPEFGSGPRSLWKQRGEAWSGDATVQYGRAVGLRTCGDAFRAAIHGRSGYDAPSLGPGNEHASVGGCLGRGDASRGCPRRATSDTDLQGARYPSQLSGP
jgi:hypothetical protein